ncbi:hypothetical protein M918_21180 [Clostridium sp. BL8]|nr:hypothetical protein [Clostridium sp. BL8]EQB89274.1 hypothetical protein M918_21180 [Clostridium sp. BL8]
MYFEPSKDLVDIVKRIKDKQHVFHHQQDNFNVNNGNSTVLKA